MTIPDDTSPVRTEVLREPNARRACSSALNHSNGVSEMGPERMFDLLWRKDQARGGDRHFELGLSAARTPLVYTRVQSRSRAPVQGRRSQH